MLHCSTRRWRVLPKIAFLAVSLTAVFAATAPRALAASPCTSSSYVYGSDPSPGWFTYGQQLNCSYQINTYDLVTCLQNVSTGQDVAGSCRETKGTAGWAVYSIRTQYTLYYPNAVTRAVGRWSASFR